jgi:hypothetical protein
MADGLLRRVIGAGEGGLLAKKQDYITEGGVPISPSLPDGFQDDRRLAIDSQTLKFSH